METKIFVYGTLRQGCGNHYILENSKFLGNGVLTGAEMYVNSYGAYPYVTLINNELEVVYGEVYEVSENVLNRINWLEGYRTDRKENHYDRQTVTIRIGMEYVESFVYVVGHDRISGLKKIESSDWIAFKSRIKDYVERDYFDD